MSGASKFCINKKSTWLGKFLAGALAVLFFAGSINFFSPAARNVFYSATSPLRNFFWSAGSSSSWFLGSLLNAGNFAKENQNLKDENQKLLAQISSLKEIVGGNQALTAVSSACQNDSFKLQMAGVIGLANGDKLTINKGTASGILEGMPVINQEKSLLGKVSKAYKNYSEVMLVSNKNSVVNVKVLQAEAVAEASKEIDGVIKGKEGLGIFLDLVPIDDQLNEGDVVVTSALEGIFPKDLLVGKIVKVEKNDQNPHQQAEVEPFFNINTDNLFVITNYKR